MKTYRVVYNWNGDRRGVSGLTLRQATYLSTALRADKLISFTEEEN